VSEQTQVKSILVAASGFIYRPTSGNNLGDRAQLTQTIERLRAAFPGSRLVAIANSLNDKGELEDLEVSYSAIRYLTSPVKIPGIRGRLPTGSARALRVLLLLANGKRMARRKPPVFLSRIGRMALLELQESSALFISGAGAFNDFYILSVGGFWGILVRCMSFLGKPIVGSGQQVGPFKMFGRRALARWALRPIDLLGVRDPPSIACASALDVPEHRIVLTGDDAWDLVPVTPEVAQTTLDRHGIPERFIAAQLRFGSSVGWEEADSHTVALSLGHLSSELGLPVVFVPCMTSSGADDRYPAACVQEHLDVPSWAVTEELDARATKALLGRAELAVGTANHFCVFAASMGTPVIGLHATPYMEQKLKGVAQLWPKRVAAFPKDVVQSPAGLAAEARRLLEQQIESGPEADNDEAAVELQPEEPIRFLAKLLAETQDQAYSTRFVETASAETYDREFGSGRFMENVSELEFRIVRSALGRCSRKPFHRHLDFACGPGRAIGFVEGFAQTTVAVDVSAEMLDRARERFPTTRFVCGDVSRDPNLLDQLGPFDLVTVWRFIAPAGPGLRFAALSAIARSMNDGGFLFVNNNANRASLHGAVLFLRSLVKVQRLRSSIPYQGSLPHGELCRLLESVGFRVEETRAICYLPEQVTRRLPARLWVPIERALSRLNIAPQHAVDQLVIARRTEHLEGWASAAVG